MEPVIKEWCMMKGLIQGEHIDDSKCFSWDKQCEDRARIIETLNRHNIQSKKLLSSDHNNNNRSANYNTVMPDDHRLIRMLIPYQSSAYSIKLAIQKMKTLFNDKVIQIVFYYTKYSDEF